jgi:hypothetical protein
MTFKTFDELDQQAGPGALFANYANKPLAETTTGYDTAASLARAQELASRSVFAAAFRRDNTVVSMLSRKDLGVDNDDDGQFDPVEYVRSNNLQGYEDSFIGVLNARRADAVKAQIEMEQRDRETLAASGWAGTFAQIAAGVFDAPTLIPGTVAVRGAKGGWSIGRSMLLGGVSAGATQAATEGFLQATQETRTAAESAINIGAAAVLGSLLGGGVAAVLGKNERIAAQKALENIADIQSGKVPNEFVPEQLAGGRPAAGGADIAEGSFFVDPVDAPRSRADLEVQGAAANAAVKATSWFNPVLRATQRYAASARQIGNVVYENTIYRAMHSAGETTGVSVEAAIRTRVTALQAEAATQAQAAYKEMRNAGVRMGEDDFYKTVGVAMRNNDQSDNPAVARAAQAYRKLFDTFTDDALKMKRSDGTYLLDERDLDVKTAASYFSRIYNRDRLLASEPEFLDLIGRHFAERMGVAYNEDAAKVTASRALYRQRLDDLRQTGDARAARMAEIERQGELLDQQNPMHVDARSDLKVLRGELRAARTPAERAEAKTKIEKLKQQGGPELEAYLEKSAELKSRMRNLSERNPDAQLARGERLQERIEDLQDQVSGSLAAFAKRTKNLLNEVKRDPGGRAADAADSVREQIVKLREQATKTAERANKLGAQYVEAMDPQRAFQEAAVRAAAQGQEGQAAIRAGTREADRVTKQIDQSKAAIAQYERQIAKLEDLADRMSRRETAVEAARDFAAELEATLKSVDEQVAARSIRRGEKSAELRARAAKLTPEQVAERAARQEGNYTKVVEDVEARFDNRWGARKALGIERNERYDFEAAGRQAAKDVYDTITGKVKQREDIPSFITKVSTGPLKDRTFMVPDELLAGRGWLVDDVREVANRYARSMAGEIELTRRFGRADMADQIAVIAKEYSDIRVAVDEAKDIAGVNAALGRDKFGPKADLAAAKVEANRLLAADEASAITDVKAGRDLIRGTYNADVNNSNFGAITRTVMHFNYIRQMGGVLLSNIGDFYRPATVHGLGPYMRNMPDLMAQAFNAGSDGLKLSLQEAKLAGLVVERVTHARQAANGDIADPFIGSITGVERFMQKASAVASRWNLINVFTDAQQAIASTVSQHRILEAVLNAKPQDGSFVHGDPQALLRMLGIGKQTQADIARYVTAHGQTVDGIRVANTERWLAAANATGNATEIARAENAVRTYRAAVNTDVNSVVSRRGIGDAPLFANHPLGKVLTQFSGYTMGAHSRVMIRGLQESHSRLIGGLVVMTSLGALTSYLAAWRGGQERWKKYVEDTTKNPALLIGEGLDRSGFFPLLFDFSNRVERASTSIGYQYKFNPIKSSVRKAAGGNFFEDTTSTRSSEAAGLLSAVGGPSLGLLESATAAGRVAAAKAEGRDPPKRDVNQALAVVPYQSYYGMREFLQVLTGNSNYTRN